MAKVTLQNLVKEYEGDSKEPFRAVKSINLEIKDQEFMVLVGPSGCGKSTTLRMIAGLEDITDGEILIGDRIVNNVVPKDRKIAMVFQNYALYPHMTVFDNMAFGLKIQKQPREEIRTRVMEAAEILGITTMLDRKPKALSGGQRQRVAVGRAIVRKPEVFLFDEPLSNLDAKMRVQMRTEISKLHARLSATMIYVTHDQVEAMTMGDRICVMKDGNIMQVADPLELYNNPNNIFVGGFIGSPPMNFFQGEVREGGSTGYIFVEKKKEGDGFQLELNDRLSKVAHPKVGKAVTLGVRPEDIADYLHVSSPDPKKSIDATIEVSEPMGSETYIYLDTGDHSFIAKVKSEEHYEIGKGLKVQIDLSKAHLFDTQSEDVLR